MTKKIMLALLFPLTLIALSISQPLMAQSLWLSHYDYPYPVNYFTIIEQNKPLTIAYMDIQPEKANGETVLLLHGKNFPGAYWEKPIKALTEQGYRVIVPDQIGFGKSSKPIDIAYSFHSLALNTKQLLDHLNIQHVNVIAHSMGGMLAVRFSLMFPDNVDKLILEDPLGLEDYRIGVPYATVDQLFLSALNNTPNDIIQFHKNYFVNWDESYGQWATLQAESLIAKDRVQLAWVSALTYEMIYLEPVIYELGNIQSPTLLVIGLNDRTAPGKPRAQQNVREQLGNFPALGKAAAETIPDATLIELDNIGHIPHLEAFPQFIDAVQQFLGHS